MDGCFGLIVGLIGSLMDLALAYLLMGVISCWVCEDLGIEWNETIWIVSFIVAIVVIGLIIFLLYKYIDKKLSE